MVCQIFFHHLLSSAKYFPSRGFYSKKHNPIYFAKTQMIKIIFEKKFMYFISDKPSSLRSKKIYGLSFFPQFINYERKIHC